MTEIKIIQIDVIIYNVILISCMKEKLQQFLNENETVISAVSKLYFDKDMSILSKARLHMQVLIYLLNFTEKKLLIPQIIYDEHIYEK